MPALYAEEVTLAKEHLLLLLLLLLFSNIYFLQSTMVTIRFGVQVIEDFLVTYLHP